MQAIARANRISEGKNKGLILDYIETYTALLDALAIYVTDGNEDGGGKSDLPVIPNKELVRLLEETLISTKHFCSRK